VSYHQPLHRFGTTNHSERLTTVALRPFATSFPRLVRLCDRQTTSLKMSAKHDEETKVARAVDTESPPPTYGGASVQDDQAYVYKDDQKLGYTATVFVILNKMIGTGSMYTPLPKFNTHSHQAQFFPLRPVSSQSLALLAYPFFSGL
jgi:hypothetical protein